MPILLEMMSGKLLAEASIFKQSIIWLQGQSSGIHRSGIWNYPGFHAYLEKHFTVISTESPDLHSIAIEISGKTKPHILILDGYFSQDLDDPINILL